MSKWELAKKLYDAGFSHGEVRRMWAYVWNEQHVGKSGKKKPWEAIVLQEVGVNSGEIQFSPEECGGEVNNYF